MESYSKRHRQYKQNERLAVVLVGTRFRMKEEEDV